MKSYATFINQRFCAKNGLSKDLSLKEFKSENKKYYREIETYDWVNVTDNIKGLEAILHRAREKKTQKLIKKLQLSGKFLDVGCGTGLILRHLPKGSVGLDINPRNIKQAKKHAPLAKLIAGDIEKMPFPKHSFDVIVCTDVLEHLIDPEIALKEIFRVLKAGGILIGSVPSEYLLWHLRFLSSTHPGEPYHQLYKKDEVKALFKKYDKIISLEKACFGMNIFFIVRND